MRPRLVALALFLAVLGLQASIARADVKIGNVQRKGRPSPEFVASFFTCDANERGHGACIRHNYRWYMADAVEAEQWCTGSCFQAGARFYWRLSVDHLYLAVKNGRRGPFDIRAGHYTRHFEDAHSKEHGREVSKKHPERPDDCIYPSEDYVICKRSRPYQENLFDPAVVGVGVIWTTDATGENMEDYVAWAGE